MKQIVPAAERNKQPILEVLQRVLPPGGGQLLEVASGTGQHAAHFARGLPAWTLQPTDVDPARLPSIAAHVEEAAAAGLTNLLGPRLLDVQAVVPDREGAFERGAFHALPALGPAEVRGGDA